jgi:ketosteroid isomerase-like protein
VNEQPVAVVRALYESFLQRDLERVVGLLSADVEWVEHFPFRGVARSPAEVAAVFAAVARQFVRYDMALGTFFEEGDEVAVRGRYTVQHRERSGTFESTFVHLYRVRGGRVARYEGLLDTARAQALFGRLEP